MYCDRWEQAPQMIKHMLLYADKAYMLPRVQTWIDEKLRQVRHTLHSTFNSTVFTLVRL
jgi:hypothetical protein